MRTPDPQLIDEVVSRIKNTVRPRQIILFGSAARQEMDRDSDLDFLIVMPEGAHRRDTAKRVYRALRGLGVSKDIIVVTERDLAEHKENPSLVLKPAIDEGRELYIA